MKSYLPRGTMLCLVGGSALTLLGIRHSSEDVDFLPLNHESEISDAVSAINNIIRSRGVYIPITDKGLPQTSFFIGKEALVQNMGRNLPSARLPPDFMHKTYRVKKLPWVIPEKGKEVHIRTKELLPHIEVYVPNLIEIVCLKLFAGRKKDNEDIRKMIEKYEKTKRYLRRYKKELKKRFEHYLNHNEGRPEAVRATQLYNYYAEHYDTYFEPLQKAA